MFRPLTLLTLFLTRIISSTLNIEATLSETSVFNKHTSLNIAFFIENKLNFTVLP
jgi:hypothetical protein